VELPTALAPEARDTLLAVLNHAPFAGREELLAQAATALVIGHCTCGCATVDLSVDRALPAATSSPSPVPNEATALDATNEPLGGVLVFVRDGYLSSLEIYSYDTAPITAFPPLERLVLDTNPGRGQVEQP
jgi:hypothetical protein